MSDFDFLARILREQMQQTINQRYRNYVSGRRIGTSTYELRDAAIGPNRFYARPYDESYETLVVWGDLARVNVPVRIELEANGEWRLAGADYATGDVVFGSKLSAVVMPPLVGDAVPVILPGVNLRPGRVRAADTTTLTVYIEPFAYWYEGEEKYWAGGTLDLTSAVPGTSEQWRWVRVGINPANNTAVSANGTAQSIYDPLTEEALSAVAFDAYIPCGGIKLRNGQTRIAIAEGDIADARLHYWTPQPQLKKTNLSASAAPGVGDDSADGYAVGSVWIDTTNDAVYQCVDATAGAAVWRRLDGSGGSGSLDVQEQDGTPAVTGVSTIKVSNGTLTDEGGGVVSITTGGGSGSGSTITTGNYADSRPGSPAAGDTWVNEDGYTHEVYHDTAWNPYMGTRRITYPPTSSWSWVNQGTASETTSAGVRILSHPGGVGGDNVRARVRTAPATPYTITAALSWNFPNQNFMTAGICHRESSSGRLVTLSVFNDGNLGVLNWNSPTSANATVAALALFGVPYPIWLQMTDDGTNRIYRYSANQGFTWRDFYTVSRTTFATADEVGFFIYSSAANAFHEVTLWHWAVT